MEREDYDEDYDNETESEPMSEISTDGFVLVPNYYSLVALQGLVRDALSKRPFVKSLERLETDIDSFLTDLVSKSKEALFDYSVMALTGEMRHGYSNGNCPVPDFTRNSVNVLDRDTCYSECVAYNPYQLIELSLVNFASPTWGAGYGGKKWLAIAQHIAKVDKLPTQEWVELCFSLSHNNNVYLDKSSAGIFHISRSGDYKHFMDLKFNAKTYESIITEVIMNNYIQLDSRVFDFIFRANNLKLVEIPTWLISFVKNKKKKTNGIINDWSKPSDSELYGYEYILDSILDYKPVEWGMKPVNAIIKVAGVQKIYDMATKSYEITSTPKVTFKTTVKTAETVEPEKSKDFYVGQKVVVKSWEKMCKENNVPVSCESIPVLFSFPIEMKKFCGRVFTIKSFCEWNRNEVFFEESQGVYSFCKAMIEPFEKAKAEEKTVESETSKPINSKIVKHKNVHYKLYSPTLQTDKIKIGTEQYLYMTTDKAGTENKGTVAKIISKVYFGYSGYKYIIRFKNPSATLSFMHYSFQKYAKLTLEEMKDLGLCWMIPKNIQITETVKVAPPEPQKTEPKPQTVSESSTIEHEGKKYELIKCNTQQEFINLHLPETSLVYIHKQIGAFNKNVNVVATLKYNPNFNDIMLIMPNAQPSLHTGGVGSWSTSEQKCWYIDYWTVTSNLYIMKEIENKEKVA